MYTADTLMAHYGALQESLGVPSQRHQPTRPHRDHLQETREESRVDAQQSLAKLAESLTTEEREILRQYLRCGSASRAFADAIGYEYNQARNKRSSIMKKMRKKLIKVEI
jgi:FixJ family two-component response regulator